MSITQTATGTLARADCASTRSATFFAKASRSMAGILSDARCAQGKTREIGFAWLDVGLAGLAELPDIEAEAIFGVAGPVEAPLEQRLDPALRGGPTDRGHAGIPAGGDFHVWRQACLAHQALGVGDRPFVERRDALRQLVDEAVELGVRQRPVDIAIGLREIAADVVGAQQHLQRTLSAHLPWHSCHWPAAGDQTDADFPLRQDRFLTAGKTHVA